MILVTGSDGMVGGYIQEVFSKEDLLLTDHHSMDVTDYEDVRQTFEKIKPDVVLHLAAATDLDRCERDKDWAYQTNVIGTQNIVFCSQKFNAILVYVSTSGVFNGSRPEESYTEFDSSNPVNVYAKTKWEGEKIVQNFLDRYFIVRAGWMIGGGKGKDKKFVSKMVELCRTQETIEVVNDKWGTITSAKDLLKTIRQLLKTPFYGLYHVANKGICNRYTIAMEIKKILKSPVLIRPVSSDRFPLPAPRPFCDAICNYKLSLMGLNNLPPWQEALGAYLKEWVC